MAQYVNLQSILNAALGEYQSKGFRLVQEDDDLNLYFQDEKVGTFSYKSMTLTGLKELHETCKEYLEN